MINFWKLAYKLVEEQRDQYKEENEQLREQFDYRNQSYMELYEENEQLINQLEDNDLKLLEDVRHYSIKCKDLEKENKKLKEELLQSDYVKASVFSDREEYKKQIVKLHEELKDMKLQNEELKRKR